MLIEIIGDLPVESNNHNFLATLHSGTPSIISTMRIMSLFWIIAGTSNRIPPNMFCSRFFKIYFLDILFGRVHLLRILFIFRLEKVLV